MNRFKEIGIPPILDLPVPWGFGFGFEKCLSLSGRINWIKWYKKDVVAGDAVFYSRILIFQVKLMKRGNEIVQSCVYEAN